MAAAILVLGVNGTLSDWSTAILNNTDNTAQAADSVILSETDGTSTCQSTDNADGTNAFDCTTINKYGGTATPLNPGDHQSVTVTMKNTGTATGSLTLTPGTCAKSLGSPTASQSICDVATVTVTCTAPSVLDTTGSPVALSGLGSLTIGSLPAGSSTACTFDVALPSDASPQIGGQMASQVLTWTLAS